METDKQIYSIFAAHPRWLFELADLPWPGECRFASVELKAIARTTDGVIYPDDPGATLTAAEFQFQSDSTIYNRMVIEMALIQLENAGRAIQGCIFFLTKSLDPKTEPWTNVVRVFYLDELILDIANRSPSHPLVAVFRPVFTKNRDELEKEAPKYYNQIAESDLPLDVRSKLTDVFISWIEQRFSEKGKKEIEEMLIGALPSLRDTQSGKDLIQIGKTEGKIEDLLMLLHAKFGSIDPALRDRISKLDSQDQANRLLLQVMTVLSPSDLIF